MSAPTYTLGDLLGEPDLGLELIVGDADTLQTPIRGAHAIEIDRPAQWLDHGWMMLTLGIRLRNKPEKQRQLIAELQELGASGLAFGVGVAFKNIPPALVDEARKRNFPLIVIPEQTAFREITRAVFHSTVGVESATFQRLSSMQTNLIRAFADPNPLESIVQRLSRVVHAPVAVFSLNGDVAAKTGALPIDEFASAIREIAHLPLVRLQLGDVHLTAAPIDTGTGKAEEWLAIASPPATVSPELVRAAIQVTIPLLVAITRLKTADRSQERAMRQSLFESALDETLPVHEQRTHQVRMDHMGIEFDGRFRVAILGQSQAAPRVKRHDQDAISEWLYQRLEELGAPHLLTRRPTGGVLISDDETTLTKLSAEYLEQFEGAVVGIGRPVMSIHDVATSYRDARITMQHLVLEHRSAVMYFEGLDVITQLLAEVPLERFANTAGPLARFLSENPLQLEALQAFFAKNRDVKAAADSLFLHPNTLRYRLDRLEQSLGRSLREPGFTASLHCVLSLMPELLSGEGDHVGSDGFATESSEERLLVPVAG